MSSSQNVSDPIVLSFHETLLRLSDVKLLRGPYWLNDQVISFYFEYLEKVAYKDEPQFLFISPQVTQCVKIVADTELDVFLTPLDANDRLFIFFPLNDNEMDQAGGSHWSLLVFSRIENAFFHYDSSKGSNSAQFYSFVNGIKYFLNAPRARIENIPSLQQSNGYDCGIHVLCQVDQLTTQIAKTGRIVGAPLLNYSTIQAKRKAILNIIEQLGGNL